MKRPYQKRQADEGFDHRSLETKTKIRLLGCQRNKSLIPRIKEKSVNGNAISENTPPAGGRPVEEEAKRERNRSDVTRARVEESRKGAKSPKTRLRTTKTHYTRAFGDGPRNFEPPELAPRHLTTTPHQREDVSALDRFNVHRCTTRRVLSGTGLELVTTQATIRYLYY
ncbi:uncharacterized protein TNCV_3355291 [Trichonephila clavipes]|nr:uncharacterized protein TNCV_3355291 [Trichonephila clavipes]